MRILIVNVSDKSGGASRAAYRLHIALLNEGIDSQMLVQNKSSGDHTVISDVNKVRKHYSRYLDALPVKLYKQRTMTLFSPSWLPFGGIVNRINEIDPDIVHLHWICGGMIRLEDIPKINAPVVWSLHDMWAFTGGCHYDEQCVGYENNCGNCKVLGSNKKNDLSYKVFRKKKNLYNKKKDITIVGLSRWLNECSLNSSLLKDNAHVNIPNPIDTNLYKPCDKYYSRDVWNLPKNKKLILFGALGATQDPRKGFRELSVALQKLSDSNIEFVVFGSSEPENSTVFGFKTHYISTLHDDISLVTLYSAVDVMIVPSLQENLANSIMESLACGTPVVGFELGGNSDMVEHKRNGYLAKPHDIDDLKSGIEWVLSTDMYPQLCKNSREKVVKEFDNHIVANRYIEIYKGITNHQKNDSK